MAPPYYPRGKLRADDLGATNIRIAVQDNTLLIIFEKPIDWLGLGLAEVEALIGILQERKKELKPT